MINPEKFRKHEMKIAVIANITHDGLVIYIDGIKYELSVDWYKSQS